MFALTEQFGVPTFDLDDYQYAIGVWKDNRQEQAYFYCVSTRQHYEPPCSRIFRFNLDVSNGCWETVGKVNFFCRHAAISPCGYFIWSMELLQFHPQQLIFRQINPETLVYEEFEASGKRILASIERTLIFRVGSDFGRRVARHMFPIYSNFWQFFVCSTTPWTRIQRIWWSYFSFSHGQGKVLRFELDDKWLTPEDWSIGRGTVGRRVLYFCILQSGAK